MILFFFWYPGIAMPEQKDFTSCRSCHSGIETMDENHNFPCADCHVMLENRNKIISDHSLIVRHPSSPAKVNIFCGSCHEKEIAHLKKSRHWSLAGMISQTRFLWGAQPDPMPLYSAVPGKSMKKLPQTPSSIQTPKDLVDDLLRRRCFSCHMGQPSVKAVGMFRGQGCAACHVLYENSGIYYGSDSMIKLLKDKNKTKGYPREHKFCSPIPVRQCMHCHNGSHTGGDYTGLFAHDYHQSYRRPLSNGYLPETIYLMDNHKLAKDVHCQAGLLCIDCHGQGQVMGNTDVYKKQKDFNAESGCTHCHKKSSIVHITEHNIPGMERVHCLGCHSAWASYEYGAEFIRDDQNDLSRWAPWRMQADASIRTLFDTRGRFKGIPDPDTQGYWFIGWRFRRWEYLTLGKDENGWIVPFRPHHQYRVSYVDSRGDIILDSVIPERGDKKGRGWAYMPFYPHTVQKRGRDCEACHGSRIAAGMGLKGDMKSQDLLLTKPSPPVYPAMELFDKKEKQKLMNKSLIYKKWRFKIMWQDYNK